jgi:anthranilate synthase component 2
VVQHDDCSASYLLAFSHVVLSPGPGTPTDQDDFVVGRDVLAEGTVPVLGVCLGMQGLVTTYGGVVDRVAPAHGDLTTVHHDGRGVFVRVPQDFRAVRYHSLAALAVPDPLEVTARGDDGTVMGVRHRTLPLEGVQFHPESVLSEHGAQLVGNFLGLPHG